jgi:hypothetical protein
MVFASGNLSDTHQKFESDHQCNKFCRFFQVPTIYPEYPEDPSQLPVAPLDRSHKSATHQSHSDMQLESPSHFPPASCDNSNARASAHQASHSVLAPASKPHSKPVSLANNKHTSAPVTRHPAPRALALPALALNPIAGSQHGPPLNSPRPRGTRQ